MLHRSLKVWITLLTLLCMMASTQAQQGTNITPGTLYEGPVRLFSPAYGTGLDLPAGWRGMLPAGSEMFIMERPGKAGLVLVMSAGSSAAEIQQALQNTIPLDAQTILIPKGGAETANGTYSNTFDVQGNKELAAYAIAGLFESAVGIGVLTVGPAKDKSLIATAKQVFNSLGYQKPVGPTMADGTLWVDSLRGIKLEYFYTGSSSNRHKTYYLCSDGSVSRSTSGGSMGGVGTLTSASSSQGTWSIEGDSSRPLLTISLANGDVASWVLSIRKKKLYLDGTQWFRSRAGC